MGLGYEGRLYILAFDHRATFSRDIFGIEGDPDAEQTKRIADAKELIFEGLVEATRSGKVAAGDVGVLVDEQFGGEVPRLAREHEMVLAMSVEKSGQAVFDFEYGDEFGDHIEPFDPDFSKVLVRYNPDGDADANRVQLERLRRLADWLHERDRRFLFERPIANEPLRAWLAREIERADAAKRIASDYLRFVEVYERAGS
jgi:myo-inositol catabolism protein IolC